MNAQLEKIRKAIGKSGLKKEFIAFQLGISPSTLSAKLGGRANYKFRRLELEKIARITKVSPSEFLS